MVKIQNSHVIDARIILSVDRATTNTKTRLFVVTDLSLRPDDPDHDAVAYGQLVSDVGAYMDDHSEIEGADFIREVK